MAKNPFKSSRGVYGSDSDVLEQFLLLQNPRELQQNLDKAKKTLSTFYSKEIKSALEEQVEVLKKEIRDEFKGKSDGLSKDVKDKVKKDADEVANIYGDAQKSVAEEASKEIEGDAGGGGGTKGIQWSKIGKNIGSSLASNAIQMLTQGFKQWSESTYGKLDIMGSMGKGNSLFAQMRSELGNLTWSQNSLRDYSKTVQSSFKQLQEDGVLVSPSTIYGMYSRLGDLVSLTGSSGARLTSLLNTVTKIQESSGVLDTSSDLSQTAIGILGQDIGGALLEDVNAMMEVVASQNQNVTDALKQNLINNDMAEQFLIEARNRGLEGQAAATYASEAIEDMAQYYSRLADQTSAQTANVVLDLTNAFREASITSYTGAFSQDRNLAAFVAGELGTDVGSLFDNNFLKQNQTKLNDAMVKALASGYLDTRMLDTLGISADPDAVQFLKTSNLDLDAIHDYVNERVSGDEKSAVYEGISKQNAMVDRLNFQLEEIGLEMSTDTYDNQVLGWLSIIGSQISDLIGGFGQFGSITQGLTSGITQGFTTSLIGNAGAGGANFLAALGSAMPIIAPVAAGVAAVAIVNEQVGEFADKIGANVQRIMQEGGLLKEGEHVGYKYNSKGELETFRTSDEEEAKQSRMNALKSNNAYKAYKNGDVGAFFQMNMTDLEELETIQQGMNMEKYSGSIDPEMYSAYESLGLLDSNDNADSFWSHIPAIQEAWANGYMVDLDAVEGYGDWPVIGNIVKQGVKTGNVGFAMHLKPKSEMLNEFGYRHATGSDNIPYDGYRAILHEGEMVIPAKRANWLRVAMGRKPVNYSNVPANKLTGNNSFVQSIPEYAAGDDAIGFASRFLGQKNYDRDRRNSINPYYFDCSSLVSRAYGGLGEPGSAGLSVGTPTAGGIGETWPGLGFSVIYSANQNGGQLLSKQDVGALGLLPGDVLLYRLNGGRSGRYQNISHAAMYYGGNQQIHTSSKSKPVRIEGLWNDVAMILRYGAGSTGEFPVAGALSGVTTSSAPKAALPASLARIAGSKNPMVKALLQRLGYTSTDIEAAAGTTMSQAISTGNVSSLAEFRSMLYNSATPEHQLHMFNRTRKEVGGQGDQAIQAWLETIFNRAMSRNMTLEGVVTGKYYPSQDGLNKALSPEFQSRVQAALGLVLGGSNITSFATGNASGSVGFGYGKGANDPYTLMVNGERFGIESNDKKWAEQMKQQYAMYAGGVVKRTPGGVSALIGEGAYDEAVVPLRQDKDYLGIEEMSLNIVEALDIISDKICKKLDTIISLKQQSMSSNEVSDLGTMQKSARTMALINFKGEY